VKIFIANVHREADEDEVRRLFAEIGPVKRFHLIKTDGRLRGYGFCEYEDPLDGSRAIDELHNRLFMGRRLAVQEARNDESRQR
jgi:cleavage stimulation factor subunit 2